MDGAEAQNGCPGYIYVLINPMLKGAVKIGKTFRSPDERASESSSSSGVPTPFIVAYDAYVSDCSAAELAIHDSLDSFRVNEDREFFALPVKAAIAAVMRGCQQWRIDEGDYPTPETAQNQKAEWLRLAEKHHRGVGVLRDPTEAYKYYRLAAIAGSATDERTALIEKLESELSSEQLCQALIGIVSACDVDHVYDGAQLFELASKYESGTDVQRDLGEAFYNYNLSVAKGHKAAWYQITVLRHLLTKDEILRAISLATYGRLRPKMDPRQPA
jgi:TPR repeat protein